MSLSNDQDDLFFSKLELEEIIALEKKATSETREVKGNNSIESDNCVEFDDDDDDIVLLGEVINPSASACKPGPSTSAGALDSKGHGRVSVVPTIKSSFQNRKEEKPGPSNVVPPRKCNTESGDELSDWNRFLQWFEKKKTFQTPWFQTIPITALHFSQCNSILQSSLDESQLLQFAKLLVSFLRKNNDGACHEGYRKDTVTLVEKVLLKFETDLVGKVFTKPNSLPTLNEILEDITQGYVTGELQIESSRIPELLIKLYPKAFNDIMQKVYTTESIDLLLPVCANSSCNFLKVLQCLHSGEIFQTTGSSENDSDFKSVKSNKPVKIITSLMDSLKSKLGVGFFKLLPCILQPIFVIDSAISRNPTLCTSNKNVIAEMCSLLNDLFYSSSSSTNNNNDSALKSTEFLEFLFSVLPVTSSILSDKELMKKVKFKTYPFLWMYLKNSSHFG